MNKVNAYLETVDFEKMFDRYGWDYNDLDEIVKILQNPVATYKYARDVIKDRWPEAEPIIIQNPSAAYCYAIDVIKGRWPEAEPIIMKDPMVACWYAKYVINKAG